jgi:hypothetical protein
VSDFGLAPFEHSIFVPQGGRREEHGIKAQPERPKVELDEFEQQRLQRFSGQQKQPDEPAKPGIPEFPRKEVENEADKSKNQNPLLFL